MFPEKDENERTVVNTRNVDEKKKKVLSDTEVTPEVEKKKSETGAKPPKGEGAYTSPFAHILQSSPTTLPPSFDTPQGARGEGFMLTGDKDGIPTSLLNADSTWQGSTAFSPPTKQKGFSSAMISTTPLSFIPGTPAHEEGDSRERNRKKDGISREEKDDHLTANDLYKTKLCRSWTETGTCRYEDKCPFAHGRDELRCVVRHLKYKTQIYRTFAQTGQCPYGNRCCFIHEKLPEKGLLGMLSTNAHAVITEDWTPGGNAQCLVQQQQNERNNKDDEFQLSSLFSAPKRLGIFRHITHD